MNTDVRAGLPAPEFSGLVGGQLPPGAIRTGFIPAAANLVAGDQFTFVLATVRTQGRFIKMGDVTVDTQGLRIAVTAPTGFFEAHAGEQLKAFYVVEHASGGQSYSMATRFLISSNRSSNARKWFTETFGEFFWVNSHIPKRLGFYEYTQATRDTLVVGNAVPYVTGMVQKMSGTQTTMKLDFTARRIRFGVQMLQRNTLVQLFDASQKELFSQPMTKSGWFDHTVPSGGIASIRLSSDAAYLDNLMVFPDRPDQAQAEHLGEDFNSLPLDEGVPDMRLLPAWRVSAASSRIAIESVGAPGSGHFLTIDQKADSERNTDAIHYFSPRIAFGPVRLAITLRCQQNSPVNVQVVAMYEKRNDAVSWDAIEPEAMEDTPRYVVAKIILDASVQTIELGGALPDEFLSCVSVNRYVNEPSVIFYDELIAT